MEPNHGGTSRAWSWRHAVAESGLPPITRLVLHTLGLKMDATGGSCYPSISDLVSMTGLDKKTVLKHLDIAEEGGWIEIGQHGYRGQKWKRNEYVARWPGRDLTGHAAPEPCEGGGSAPPPSAEKVVEMVPEGGGNGSTKVVEELHQDKILPNNIPENSPAAAAARESLKANDRRKIEASFVSWMAQWPNKSSSLDFARNAWNALTAEERAACIARTPAYLAMTPKDEPTAAAVYLKNRAWEAVPDAALQPRAVVPRPAGWAKTFAPEHAAAYFRILSLGPDLPDMAPSGGIWLSGHLRTAWPRLWHFWQQSDIKGGIVVGAEDLATSGQMEFVPEGCERMTRWRAVFRERGWPEPKTMATGAYFPAGEPDGAIEQFRADLAEGQDDDAA